MFQKPRVAKRLYFDVIPRAVDEYYQFVAAYQTQDAAAAAREPGVPCPLRPSAGQTRRRSASRCCSTSRPRRTRTTPSVLWGFISRYVKGATRRDASRARPARGLRGALLQRPRRADQDLPRSRPTRSAHALQDLADQLAPHEGSTDAEELQNLVYEVGKAHKFEPLRDWFDAIYQVLLGADQGPRFGSFIALYGVAETRKLIADALAGKLIQGEVPSA